MNRTDFESLATRLLHTHGLDVQGWRWEFRTYARRLGCCYYRKKLIALNGFYVENNSEAHVLDTLLHEIAHALAGPAARHGPVWKAMARRLGCTPKACSKSGLTLRPGKYQATCPCCGRVFHKHRKPRYSAGYYCPPCGKERGRLVFVTSTTAEGALS